MVQRWAKGIKPQLRCIVHACRVAHSIRELVYWRWLYLVSAVVQERLQPGIDVEFAQSDAQGAIGGDGAVQP
eukprot:3762982-Prymnesium_polylepis.1